jgi:hypothetical protein
MSATTGVLFKKALTTKTGAMKRRSSTCTAVVRAPRLGMMYLRIGSKAPVRSSPVVTAKSTITVSSPRCEKPAVACVVVRIPHGTSVTSAPTIIMSGGATSSAIRTKADRMIPIVTPACQSGAASAICALSPLVEVLDTSK